MIRPVTTCAFLAAALLAASCIGPFRPLPRIDVGRRVEVESDPSAPDLAIEVDEKPAEGGISVTAPVEVDPEGELRLLGVPIELADGVDFEDEDRQPIEPFPLEPGAWIHARGEEREGRFRVRRIRRAEPRERVEVEGPLTAVRREEGEPVEAMSIAPFEFRLGSQTDVELIDPDQVWRSFLETGPLARRATKEEKFVPFTVPVTDDLRLGGQLSGEIRHEEDFDLERSRRRDKDQYETGLEIDALHRIGEYGFALLSVELKLELEDIQDRPDERAHTFRPKEAYVFLPDLGVEGLHLQAGRQDFDERREWLWDQPLDGVRLYWQRDPIELEGSVSTNPNLLAPKEPAILNWIGAATLRLTEDWRVGAYVIDRESRHQDDFSPMHLGVRSFVKPDPGFSHWLELSSARGTVEGRDLRGWAVDAGATWVADVPLEPSITLGYALGSGDSSPGSTDRTFRQTGLHDNNDKWNGVTSFRYYGEALEPELSNLRIATAGLGIRPTRGTSIDVVGHVYRQDERVAAPLRAEIDEPTNGLSKDVGFEVDAVLGWRATWFSAELIGGWFEPGDAMTKQDPAWLTAAQLRFKF